MPQFQCRYKETTNTLFPEQRHSSFFRLAYTYYLLQFLLYFSKCRSNILCHIPNDKSQTCCKQKQIPGDPCHIFLYRQVLDQVKILKNKTNLFCPDFGSRRFRSIVLPQLPIQPDFSPIGCIHCSKDM